MKIDHQKFINLYKSQYGALNGTQTSGLGALLSFLEQDKDVGDPRWAAYMLATVKHECANQWQPIEEYGRGQGMAYGNSVTVQGSDGKTYTNSYYGRGYVQLTWEANYRNMSHNLNLGDQILVHPERALEPSIAYRILSFGMRNGSFTGVGLGNYISGSKCDYYDARQIVNGFDQAALIQGYAQNLEALLRQSSNGEGKQLKGKQVYHIVNAPVGVQARKGPGTNLPAVGTIANNSPIEIVCQLHGESINGSDIWNKLADGTYVTDYYCDTPNFAKFSPPIPVCKDASPPAQPPTKGDAGNQVYHIVNAPAGVQARRGPGTNFPAAGMIADNSPIQIVCQLHGESINGSDIWNKLADGTYVTDYYCDTPNFAKFSPPIPVCKDAPQRPPVQPGIKGDDYPYRGYPPDQPDQWGFLTGECTSFVAHRMNQLGINFTNGMKGGTFGHGYMWANNARRLGYRVDHSPSVGAIAWYDQNAFGAWSNGHVAYVAQVNGDGSIVIEEFNWGLLPSDRYVYRHPPRVTDAAHVSAFIHIV